MKTTTRITQAETVFPEEGEDHVLFDLAKWTNGLALRNINFSPTGRPVIKINELKHGITSQTQFTEQEFNTDYFLSKGDMLFSWSGQPETSIDVFWYTMADGWLNQHIFKVQPSPKVDRVFLFYLLKSLKPLFIQIARNKQTTGLGHVTVNDLKRLQLRIPTSKDTQREMVGILDRLDSKIELNQQMNQTLETIGQSVFKHWFIDFEFPSEQGKPYKSSGGEIVYREKLGKEIPKEWVVQTISEVCDLAYGEGLREDTRTIGAVPVYGSNGQVGWHDKPLVRGPGIVVGRKGNPGTVKWVQSDFFPIDTTYYVIPKVESSLHYLYYALSRLGLPSLVSDTAVPGLNRTIAYRCDLTWPTVELQTRFAEIDQTLKSKIHENNKESRVLSTIRDSLLPKLLSGKVRVPIEVR